MRFAIAGEEPFGSDKNRRIVATIPVLLRESRDKEDLLPPRDLYEALCGRPGRHRLGKLRDFAFGDELIPRRKELRQHDEVSLDSGKPRGDCLEVLADFPETRTELIEPDLHDLLPKKTGREPPARLHGHVYSLTSLRTDASRPLPRPSWRHPHVLLSHARLHP